MFSGLNDVLVIPFGSGLFEVHDKLGAFLPPPPAGTFYLITEAGEFLLTEAGEFLITE